MYNSSIFFGFFTILVAISSAKEVKKEITCPADELKNFDKVSSRIISFTKQQRPFPTTKETIGPYCQDFKKDHVILDKFIGKCLQGGAKNFGQVLIYSLGAVGRTYCNPKNKRKQAEIMAAAKCVNNDKVRPQAELLVRKYADVLKHGAVAKPAKNRMGYACCHYFRLLSEMEATLKPHCTAKQITSVIDFVRNIVQSFVDVACLNFTDASDACDHLPAPPAEMYKSMLANSTSFVVPLIELFASLDN